MKVVVTLDKDGQVEVYASKECEVVLIDNSVADQPEEEELPDFSGTRVQHTPEE